MSARLSSQHRYLHSRYSLERTCHRCCATQTHQHGRKLNTVLYGRKPQSALLSSRCRTCASWRSGTAYGLDSIDNRHASRRHFTATLFLIFTFPTLPLQASDAEPAKRELPKNYVKFARKLLDALRDSIEVDLSSAEEPEVRRKADPAKALVREWVQKWRDIKGVTNEVSYKQITGAQSEILCMLKQGTFRRSRSAVRPPALIK